MPLRDISAMVAGAQERAVKLAAEHVLSEARKEVPITEGTLARSGATAVEGQRAVVYFDTQYAVRQHEELGYRHDQGRKAKYLEDPMNRERGRVLQIMRDAIATILGT